MQSIQYKLFWRFRAILAILLGLYAINAIWRFASPGSDSSKAFNVVEIIFWTLGPPLWFFLEYWTFDSGELIELPRENGAQVNKEGFLKGLKRYADYASKIWAAILVVLVFLFGANVTGKQHPTHGAREQGAYSSSARRR